MLRNQFQKAGPGKGVDKFILQIGFIICKFSAQVNGDFPSQCVILFIHNVHPSEDDHAADVQGPVAFLPEALVTDTETDLVMLPDRIQFMTGFRTVELEPAVFFAVPVIHRDTIGIVIITQHGKDTAGLLFQDLNALRFGNLLFEPSHFPEHCLILPV